MADQTINVPQLLLVIVLGGLAIRYFFFSSNAQSGAGGANQRGGISAAAHAINVRAREADVERIQQMFPQVSRRSIMWDLQRNGGNVVATTERVLSGRGLEVPPQSFQPPLPAGSSSSSAAVTATSSAPKSLQPDLITRYNLKSKLAEDASRAEGLGEDTTSAGASGSASANGGSGKRTQAWSTNKNERQALLQRRREEMILTARRKMEAKVAQEALQGQVG